jgi:ribosomal protein L16 Arg81 hydroxylase
MGPYGVNAEGLHRQLARGATLIIDNVEECFEPLRRLIKDMESLFHVRAQANLYAAWRALDGFGLHWDDQDTIIVQVSGQKKWKLYKPTCPRPSRGVDEVPEPKGPAIWQGTLQEGDLLHVPWGWWHIAQPIGIPTLHLTLTVSTRRGVDFIRWLSMHDPILKACARETVPLFDTEAVQKAWIQEICAAFSQASNSDLIEQYLSACDRQMPARFAMDLPSCINDNAPKLNLVKKPVKQQLIRAIGELLHSFD